MEMVHAMMDVCTDFCVEDLEICTAEFLISKTPTRNVAGRFHGYVCSRC
ncbi:hypothetical protein TRIP_B330524 [uncultured Desulfatiglans sp.]|uniref:Uncharacterized protein n=1 Tax=Uncultured Desulfatiglans sp. TaxID=1748965 RepID=A0A653A8Z0_UNCDX|nr:hypothetical protein TRIP_B330524 [uncultured Desulfatiglans sp.]